MPTIAEYLKYANLQMAAEAFLKDPDTGAEYYSGDYLITALEKGNKHASLFTESEAMKFADPNEGWIVLDQRANTPSGFSGTLFKNNKTGELVISFRSTEFIDDAIRDNAATNTLEIKNTGFAWGQLTDMEDWYQSIKSKIPAGSPLDVTAYSLGGHLATAFNLLHRSELNGGQVVTFNGAGIGQIDGTSATATSLASVLKEFKDDLNSLQKGTGEVKARLFTIPEVAALYEQIKAQIDPAKLPDDATTQENMRTRTAFSLMRVRTAISQVENFSLDPYDLEGPPPALFKQQKDILLKALNDIADQEVEALRIATFTSGDGKNASPQLSDPRVTVAETLDYRLAVDLVAQRTQSAALVIGGIQAVAGKRYGSWLRNQYDVVGTETTRSILTLTTPYAAVANSQWHYGMDVPLFIEDQPLYRGNVRFDAAMASLDYKDVKLLVDQYAKNDFADTHSLVLIVDSLNVQNALTQLAPDATQAGIEAIFMKASNLVAESTGGTQGKCEGDVLENIVNALADMLLGPGSGTLKGDPIGNSWWSIADIPENNGIKYTGRNSFYAKLDDILKQAAGANLIGNLALSASSPALKGTARDNFAEFVALYDLSPLVLSGKGDEGKKALNDALKSKWGEIYERWYADSQLSSADRSAKANFGEQWLEGRATMLDYWLTANAANKSVLEGDLSYTDKVVFKDIPTEQTVTVVPIDQLENKNLDSRYVVFGGKDSDPLDGDKKNDALYGMAGDDFLNGKEGNDILDGGSGNDALDGGTGNDSLIGGAGDDILAGGTDNDTLIGGFGDDTYVFASGDGRDWIDDADGVGHITYDGAVLSGGKRISENVWKEESNSKVFRYALVDWTENGDTFKRLSIDGPKGGMFVKNWQPGQLGLTLDGTEAPAKIPTTTATLNGDSDPGTLTHLPGDPTQLGDRLTGTAANDLILGVEGNDILEGGAGDDRLQGGNGVDDLFGGAGNDLLEGGGDGNLLYGGAGDDQLWTDKVGTLQAALDETLQTSSNQSGAWLDGGDGNNLLVGGSGTDALLGGLGMDILIGGGDTDFIYGDVSLPQIASWSERITYGAAADKAMLEENPDTYRDNPEGKADLLYGGIGNDFLYGQGGDDILDGGSGNDVLNGGAGNDMLLGQAGDDTLRGDMDTKYLDSQWHGDDTLNGGDGNDVLYGNGGADRLFGDSGNDTLYGNEGDDTLDGGSDNDVLNGGAGNDMLLGQAGNDTLRGDMDAQPLDSQWHGDDTLNGGDGDDVLYGNGGADRLFGESGNDTLYGNEGNDILDGGSENDVLYGNEGNDILVGGAGMDYLEGGAGDDTYRIGANDAPVNGSTAERISSVGGGKDKLELDVAYNQLKIARQDNDIVLRWSDNSQGLFIENGCVGAIDTYVLAGQSLGWMELINRALKAPVQQTSSTPNVTMTGGGGGDRLTSTGGGANIYGGAGSDVLIGRGGNNTYHYAKGDGTDLIIDSSAKTDAAGNPSPNTLSFGVGIAPEDIKLTLQGALVIQVGNDPNDAIRIGGFDASGALNIHSIDQFAFADGTLLTYQQLVTRGFDLDGSTGSDMLQGTSLDDRISGGAGNDTLEGGAGSDTYLFGRGDGNDTIDNTGNDANSIDTLQFQDDIGPDDVVLSRVYNNLVLTLRGSGDSVSLTDYFAGKAIDRIVFADATVWDGVAIEARLKQDLTRSLTDADDSFYGTDGDDNVSGLGGNDYLYGGPGNDTLDGGIGNDSLQGGQGDDVFRFGVGGGCDAIFDAGACGNDRLELGAGIDPDNLVAQASGNNLILGVRGTTDQVTLGGFFARDAEANDSLKVLFADGTIWNEADLSRQSWANAAKDGTYWGSSGDDFIQGGEGNDTISGHAGNDTLAGDEDDDVLLGNEGDDHLQGGEGNDLLYGDGDQADSGSYNFSWYDERYDCYYHYNCDSSQIPDGLGGNDTLDGGSGNDYLAPGPGNNVILFGKGDGKDLVNLYGGSSWLDPEGLTQSSNVVRFKAGISPDEVSVQLTTRGELCVRIKGTHDGLYIDRFADYSFDYAGMMVDTGGKPHYERLPQFQFADGTVWDTATVLPQMVIHPTDGDDNIGGLETNDIIDGGAGNDFIAGNSGDDTISGGSGDDVLWGGYGNDTFLFGRGDGIDTILLDVNDIVERIDGSFDTGEINTLQFKNGISPQDIVVARGGRSPLVLAIAGTTDRVVLSDYSWVGSYPGQYPINQVKFADGTVWDSDKLLQLEEAPTSKITTAIADLSAKAQAPFEFKVPLYVDPSWANLASASAKLENGDPLPSWLQFDSETQELSGMPGPDDVGEFVIAVSVTDPNEIEDITKLHLVVTRENRAPVVNVPLDDQAAAEHAAFSFTLPANAFVDPDVGDVLSYGASLANGDPLPGWLRFDAAAGTFSGTPSNDDVGTLNVVVTATDQDGLSVSTGFAIAVANVNDAPVASGDVITATEDGGPISVAVADLLANDSDPDLRYGDVLSIASVSQAASGANVSLSNGVVKYDPGQLYQGLGQGETATDSFTYTVVDAAGAASTATVSVLVTGVNDAPVVTDNFAGVSEDGALTAVGNVLADDYDIDRGTVLAVANAGMLPGKYGSLTLAADGGYQYRLNNASAAVQGLRAGQVVTDVFTYQATDGMAVTPAALTINITGTNDAPVIRADAARMSEDGLALPVTGNVLANDSDVDQGTTLRVANAGVFKGSYGTLTLKSDGAYSYALDSTLRTVQQLATASSLNEEFVCQVTDGVVTATTTLAVVIDGAARPNVLTGGIWQDRIVGTAGNDAIDGGRGNDVLSGQDGSDRLDGGTGCDTMYGGKGNDVYVVDNGGDSVIEYANEGIDTVLSSISYSLGRNVENLTLTGTAMMGFGNAADNALLGNASANLLLDGAGNDTLDGCAGIDILSGGSGNDTYVLGRGYGADLLFEYDSSSGNADVLSFQPGIAADQLWFRRIGNNLEVDIIGTTDSMTVQNWYSGSAFHVEQFKIADGKVLTDTRVQNLVQAMASFTPPSAGQTSLPPAYQTALQPVIAVNWQ
jgi:VCBS repeat-containing protein